MQCLRFRKVSIWKISSWLKPNYQSKFRSFCGMASQTKNISFSSQNSSSRSNNKVQDDEELQGKILDHGARHWQPLFAWNPHYFVVKGSWNWDHLLNCHLLIYNILSYSYMLLDQLMNELKKLKVNVLLAYSINLNKSYYEIFVQIPPQNKFC